MNPSFISRIGNAYERTDGRGDLYVFHVVAKAKTNIKKINNSNNYNNNNKQNVKQDGTQRRKEVRAEEINTALKEERESEKTARKESIYVLRKP